MVVAEISIIPIGTETTSVSRYVSAAVKEIEAAGFKCSLGPMGTTIEADSIDEVYAAIARAQAAVFDLGAGRTYTILKIDERRDVEDRSMEDMVRSAEEGLHAR